MSGHQTSRGGNEYQAPRGGCVAVVLLAAIVLFCIMLGLFVYVIQYGGSDTIAHRSSNSAVTVGTSCPHLNAKGHTRKRVGGRATYSTKLTCKRGADGRLRWTYA